MRILFSYALTSSLIPAAFGAGLDVPAPKPSRSAPYWDADSQSYVDPIPAEARAWWAYQTFKAEIEAADRQQALHDAWVDRHMREWEARERAFDECLMGRV